METYFCLYACCIPVKGFKRSTVCDLQRDTYIFIPNTLYEILTEDLNKMSIEELLKEMEGDAVLDWLDMLVENDYAYYTEDYLEFINLKPINPEYLQSSSITNSIIDFDTYSAHDVKNIFNELSSLMCQAMELRFFYPEKADRIKEILGFTSRTTLRTVELLVAYHPSYTPEVIQDLFHSCFRLRKLTFHSYSDNLVKELPEERILVFTETKINSEAHCGVVSPNLFISNLSLFLESQKNNSCLNKKISIDKYGNIKNCPSQANSYGKITETTLTEVVSLPSFKEVWNVSKEMVEVCKDCEFRHMCIDCRAYLKEPENDLSMPLKCNYNPYEAIWN